MILYIGLAVLKGSEKVKIDNVLIQDDILFYTVLTNFSQQNTNLYRSYSKTIKTNNNN